MSINSCNKRDLFCGMRTLSIVVLVLYGVCTLLLWYTSTRCPICRAKEKACEHYDQNKIILPEFEETADQLRTEEYIGVIALVSFLLSVSAIALLDYSYKFFQWSASSIGLEHDPSKVEVTGSSPVRTSSKQFYHFVCGWR